MMNKKDRPHILLTNDDGIRSPGLWAAAEALSDLGYVVVAAPRDQSSGAGRSMPRSSDGSIRQEEVEVGGKCWPVYAVGGSPAQAVQHGVLEIAERKPDLVVAGINYGENIGIGITISGTVGAALEAAALGIPALAVSLETDMSFHLSYSKEVDFSVAAYFAHMFAQHILSSDRLPDVDVLKIDVPSHATVDTPWQYTRISRGKYYYPVIAPREEGQSDGPITYGIHEAPETWEEDSDVHTLRVAKHVSVTPISLDMTSRVNGDQLNHWFSPDRS
ncbi:MAG: 5'/3'-nucleotidase SurE [Anaerolineales bacterium]|jgi:5'-nucleotidase